MNLTDTLKGGSRGTSGAAQLLRESMIVAEVAASLILVIGAGLLVRSFIRLERTDPGFRPEQLLTAQIALPVTLYKQPAQRVAFQSSLLERVAALPGVRSAAATEYIPFASGPARAVRNHRPPPRSQRPIPRRGAEPDLGQLLRNHGDSTSARARHRTLG